MAGFGNSGGGKKSGKNKEKKNSTPLKLKPKSQWDRYCDVLKKSFAVTVGVRVLNAETMEPTTEEWLTVGRIKSESDDYTELAVAMQRGLIAEHAKRLFPLQVLPKDLVEWGYLKKSTNDDNDNDNDNNGGEWIVVKKDICNDAPAGIEKKIGFEGMPDPATGFYCHYDKGRLVDRSDEPKPIARL